MSTARENRGPRKVPGGLGGLEPGGLTGLDESGGADDLSGSDGLDRFGGPAVVIGSTVLIAPAVPVGLPVVPRCSPRPVRTVMSAASLPGARVVPGAAASVAAPGCPAAAGRLRPVQSR